MSTSHAEVAPSTDVLAIVDDAIKRLQSHPDDRVREAAQALLEGIDAVHRMGLTRLVRAIQAMAGVAFVNRLTADPAIRLLLMSYSLVAVDRRLQAEEALDTVRGHLHDHGIDVELHDVAGGVVRAQLHLRRGGAHPPGELVEKVRRDLESVLLDQFVGFQELVLSDHDPRAAGAVHHVSLDQLRRSGARPIYHDVFDRRELTEGRLVALEIEGTPVLLARIEGEVYALRNRCGDSPLPLEFSGLSGTELRCSWHGCRYDVRTGCRTDSGDGRIQVFPVAIEGDRIRIALGVSRPGGAA